MSNVCKWCMCLCVCLIASSFQAASQCSLLDTRQVFVWHLSAPWPPSLTPYSIYFKQNAFALKPREAVPAHINTPGVCRADNSDSHPVCSPLKPARFSCSHPVACLPSFSSRFLSPRSNLLALSASASLDYRYCGEHYRYQCFCRPFPRGTQTFLSNPVNHRESSLEQSRYSTWVGTASGRVGSFSPGYMCFTCRPSTFSSHP